MARDCLDATGGNPLLLHGLLDELRIADGGAAEARIRRMTPASVREETARRLAREEPAVQDVALATALLGAEARVDEVAALARLGPRKTAEAADRLVALEILAPGGQLAFVHPLVEAAVLATLPEHRRRAEHARAARILQRVGAPLERVATQVLSAPAARDSWNVATLRSAAMSAMTRGAPESATSYLERALLEPPECSRRAEILQLLGRAEVGITPGGAVKHLAAALAVATERSERAEIALDLALASVHTNTFIEADATLERVQEELGEGDRELRLKISAFRAGLAQQSLSLRPTALEGLRRIAPEVERGATPFERLVLAQIAASSPFGDETAEVCAERSLRSLARGALLHEVTSDSPAFWYAASALMFAERFDECGVVADLALADANSRGSRLGMALSHFYAGAIAQRTGRPADAAAEARLALDVAPAPGPATFFALPIVALAEIDRGRASEALEFVRGFPLPEGDATLSLGLSLYTRGVLELAAGRATAAIQELEAGAAMLGALGQAPWVMPWRSDTALALVYVGRYAEAQSLAQQELELAHRWGTPRALGIALRAAARVQRPVNLELLGEAVDVLERSGDATSHARALLDVGAAHRRAGRRAVAVALLRDALGKASGCGAVGVCTEIRAELAAAGVAARPAARQHEDLTASERRVAGLAAQRLTNREIADALFVTVRTVETHLTRAYARLGVRGRRELAGALSEASAAARAPSAPPTRSARAAHR